METSALSLPWVEKYRPTDLSDVISQGEIIATIMRFVEEESLPHLLLHGPAGTGKTTTILAVARKIYGTKAYRAKTLELNASDDRGIDVVREQIVSFASTRSITQSGFKLIILDEADSMTSAAQAALRRVIEKYTSNVRFVLICNYASRIIPAIQSRCTVFRFRPLDPRHVISRLREVAAREQLTCTPEGEAAILALSFGDMRRTLNILQSTAMAYGSTITEQAVYQCTGAPQPQDIHAILHTLLNANFVEGYALLMEMQFAKGYALVDILGALHRIILTLMLPGEGLARLLGDLADLEQRLALGTNERVQAASLVAAFIPIRKSLGQSTS